MVRKSDYRITLKGRRLINDFEKKCFASYCEVDNEAAGFRLDIKDQLEAQLALTNYIIMLERKVRKNKDAKK